MQRIKSYVICTPLEQSLFIDGLSHWSAISHSQAFSPETLWKCSLPYLAIREPVIQATLVALKSAQDLAFTHSNWKHHIPTLQAYNRVIQLLVHNYNSSSKMDVYVVLVASALFVCLELIEGDTEAAIQHIRALNCI